MLLLARLAGSVTDPLVGYWSDRTTSRFGRRKIFVVAVAPFIALSVWFLFMPPADASGLHLLCWTLAIYIAVTLSIVLTSAWAAWGTASKLSYVLAIGIAFPLLELAVFSARQGNSEGPLLWLAILYGASCMLFELVAIASLRGYQITEAVHRDIRRQLDERAIRSAQPR